MADVVNVLLAGVGGQGIILASKILSTVLLESGYHVKMSEVHGMAQRGGAVTTQVRFGEQVSSPIVGHGHVDILVAFEKMEAARWVSHVKEGGKLVVNDFEFASAPILTGARQYPTGILEHLSGKVETHVIPASRIARELGNVRVQNIVLLGALVRALELERLDWERGIEQQVKSAFRQINLLAFEKGRSAFEK
ncbi:MAG TPA: indolepyruvate oxidoreductase subunit beta [Thermotogota bacterium]|nr:indolepyruvate oxidoreductase subunit beta [Thermotogota bacterium]